MIFLSLLLPLGSLLGNIGLGLIAVAALAVAAVAAHLYLRARDTEHGGMGSGDSAAAVHALGEKIELLVGEQQLQGETHRQMLAQKIDAVGQRFDEQRLAVDGLKNEVRQESRRRDAELEEIRHQIAAIQQQTAVALPPPPAAALPAHDPAPAQEEPVADVAAAPAFAPDGAPPVFAPQDLSFATGDGAAPMQETPQEPAPATDPRPPDPFAEAPELHPAAPTPFVTETFAASTPAPDAPPTLGDEWSLVDDWAEAPAATAAPSPETPPADPFADILAAAPQPLPSPDAPPLAPLPADDIEITPFDPWTVVADTTAPDTAALSADETAPAETFAFESEPEEPVVFELSALEVAKEEPVAFDPDEFAAFRTVDVAEFGEPSPAEVEAPAAVEPVDVAEFETADFGSFESDASGPSFELEAPAAAPLVSIPEAPSAPDAPPDSAWVSRAPRADAETPTDAATADAPPFAAPEGADALTVITSIDEDLQRALYRAGVTSLDEIARWGRGDARRYALDLEVSEDLIMGQWVFEAQAALFSQYARQAG